MYTEETAAPLIVLQPIMDAAFTKYADGASWSDFVGTLDGTERAVVLIGTLNYQVHNGGFVQWIDNRYATRAADVVAALGALDTYAGRRISQLVSSVMDRVSINWRGRFDIPEHETFDAEDTKFCELSNSLLDDLAAWVQK